MRRKYEPVYKQDPGAQAFAYAIGGILAWEVVAASGIVPGLPTVTRMLRGDAAGFRDQHWARKAASAGFLGVLAAHFFWGWPSEAPAADEVCRAER